MIPFNVPPFIGTELDYVKQAIDAHKICGDGSFTKKCHAFLEERFGAQKALLTTSGTTALEMATLLCGLKAGDEVLVPSFTFSSTATAIVLTGATPVFIDVRPDTMNIDETKLEEAITDRTRAIMAVHYAGVACEMDTIMDIAARHNLKVIEDAAQGVMSTYKGRPLGTIGDFGCYSFHETKNYSMGEGGALIIRNPENNDDAEILREKGTNRARFFRGQVDKYTWVAYGSTRPTSGPSSWKRTRSMTTGWRSGKLTPMPSLRSPKQAVSKFPSFPKAVSTTPTCTTSSCAICKTAPLSSAI